MKTVNEKLGTKDIKEILDGEDAAAQAVDLKRPGRLPRLTDEVKLDLGHTEKSPRYRLPCVPLTLDEIRHFLLHPEELVMDGDK